MSHNFEYLQRLAEAGVSFSEHKPSGMLPKEWKAQTIQHVMDAQPELFTSPNSGVLQIATSYIDPAVYEVLFTPMKAAVAVGKEVQKGTWTDDSIYFNLIESTGTVSSYGDFSNTGKSDFNYNFPNRQPYLFQTNIIYGEREIERLSRAKIDAVSQKNRGAVLSLNKYQNLTYLFGVEGLENFGLLNDPSLTSAISPAATGTGGSGLWSAKTIDQRYNDLSLLFTELANQTQGWVTEDSPLVFVMSPSTASQLTSSNVYGFQSTNVIKQNFANAEIVTVPEFATNGGNYIYLMVRELEGMPVAECSYNVKLRSHAVIPANSSWSQKKSQGSSGTIIYQPVGIARMLGV